MYGILLKFTEEKILSVSKTSLTIGRENLSDLSKFGLNNAYFNSFEEKIVTAEALYNEDKERHDLKMLTAIKKEALTTCFAWCRDTSIRLELAFGKASKEYSTFPSKQLLDARKSEILLSPLMETIIKIAGENNEGLSAYGQTSEVLEEGNTLLEKLRTAGSEQELKKVNKKKATQIRHKKYNELYAIINNINKVGRNLFREDMTKYVLFESPWAKSASSKAKTFKGDIAPGERKLVAEVKDMEELIFLENTGSSDIVFYAGVKTYETPELILSAGEEATVLISELGEGKGIIVENPDIRRTSSYKVKLQT